MKKISIIYLTLDELSHKLGGRSRSSIYRDVERGDLPEPTRIGRRLLWADNEIDFYLQSRRTSGQSQC